MVGAFLTVAQAAQSATAFVSQLNDFANNLRQGETAMADLDALTAVIEFQNIGGDYYATSFLLGVLLDVADSY